MKMHDMHSEVTEASSTVDSVVLTLRPWPDDVIDRVGHDPRSTYVERFWLPLLGPSSVVLLRRLAAELEDHPDEAAPPVEGAAPPLGRRPPRGRAASSFARPRPR